MTHFLVVANGEPPSPLLLKSLAENKSLVAVDGGADTCLACGLIPELVIGDFDSISDHAKNTLQNIEHIFTPDQEKSDLEKTLEVLFKRGAEKITLCAATGKRLDHTLANLCLLARYPGLVQAESDMEISFALNPSSTISCTIGQTLSFFPIGSSVRQLFTKGLKWDMHGKDLTKNFISISNICDTSPIQITFETGDLIVCLKKTTHRIH